MPAPRANRFQLGDNWPVLVFVGLLVVLIGLKGRFTGFDAHSLSVNAMPLTLIALGQFLVVLTRGVDLSLGPVASVAGAVMALTVTDHPFLGLAAPALIGLVGRPGQWALRRASWAAADHRHAGHHVRLAGGRPDRAAQSGRQRADRVSGDDYRRVFLAGRRRCRRLALHRRRRRGCSARASACIFAPSAATNTPPA